MKILTPGRTREERDAQHDAALAAMWYCTTPLVCGRCGAVETLEPVDFRVPVPHSPYIAAAHIEKDGELVVVCPNCKSVRRYPEPDVPSSFSQGGCVSLLLVMGVAVALILIVVHFAR